MPGLRPRLAACDRRRVPRRVSPGPAPHRRSGAATGAPKTPPAKICGNRRPSTAPPRSPQRAVRVPAGNDATVNFSRAHTTYWFAPGEHTLGSGEFHNIDPADGDTYVGAPGAILDGQHTQQLGL